jgi:hypothetical protein
VNGAIITVPQGSQYRILGGRIIIYRTFTKNFHVSTDFGLHVEWHRGYLNFGYVYVPRSWIGVRGMCGNNNRDLSDDLLASNGTDMRGVEHGLSHLAISWEVYDPEDPQ